MRVILIIFALISLPGCSLFSFFGSDSDDPYPVTSFETIHYRAGGLQPQDHVALASWDEDYYYFEWRSITEPATMKTAEGSGRVKIKEFDKKNGRSLERKKGVIGKEDFNGQLYNAGVY